MLRSLLLPGLTTAALSAHQTLRADMPESMQANVTASAGGGFFFKSVPAVFETKENQWLQTKEAFGMAYKIGQDDAFQETWRIPGWHTNQGYLLYMGVYFVRMALERPI